MILDRYGEIFRKRKVTFASAYKYWKNDLFSYLSKTFTIVDWEESEAYIERHLKTILLLDGRAGACYDGNGKFAIGRASLYGYTHYYDEYPSMMVNLCDEVIDCDDIMTENRNGVLLKNNSLMNGFRQKINLYASLLAHCDVTLHNGMINRRDNNIFVALTNSQAQAVNRYRQAVAEGKLDTLVDPAFSLTKLLDSASTNGILSLAEVYDIRERLLTQYLEDIGIKKGDTKRERLVSAEVNADDDLLNLNMMDVYDSWRAGIKEVNKYFNKNLRVVANIDLERGAEDVTGKRSEE